jgi:hypothetical protein
VTGETHLKNVLHVARQAGFVATHYHRGMAGTTQMVHANGNMLMVLFEDGAFHAATGYGWDDAPWTGATWSTADYETFTRMILTAEAPSWS